MRKNAGRLGAQCTGVNMPKRYKNLFEKIVALDNMFLAAENAMRGKRGKLPAAKCFSTLEKTVVNLRNELANDEWRPGEYNYFMIDQPKEREIAAAPFRDRIVHHAMVHVLEPIFEPRFIADTYACRNGKGTHACLARAHQFTKKYKYCLKCDIRQYFPSIDHELLVGQIERAVADKRVMRLVDLILDSHTKSYKQEWPKDGGLFEVSERHCGLPIGNLTSQFFANIYLHPLDLFIKHDLRVKGYLRYVDDFLLFGDDKKLLKEQGNQVREFVKTLRLTIHPNKFRMMATENGVDMVGFVLYPDGRVRVRDSNVRRFVRRFRHQQWLVRNEFMNLEDFKIRTESWISHTKHAQARGLRKDIFASINI